MPEGHKLFRLALEHQPMVGKRISVSSPQGRFEEEATILDGRILRKVESYGKHLIYRWSGSIYLHIHLGLYGKYRWLQPPFQDPRGEVRIRAISRQIGFDLNGPNQCELLSRDELKQLVNRLGPDPLRSDSRPHRFQSAVRKSAKPIGNLLLDQKVIAGIGNIYRTEILFMLGIHPSRRGCELTVREIGKIWNLSKKLLKIGVKYNAIITAAPDEVGKPRRDMEKEERILLYKKELCPKCGTPVTLMNMLNRKVFVCNQCQV